LVKEEIVA